MKIKQNFIEQTNNKFISYAKYIQESILPQCTNEMCIILLSDLLTQAKTSADETEIVGACVSDFMDHIINSNNKSNKAMISKTLSNDITMRNDLNYVALSNDPNDNNEDACINVDLNSEFSKESKITKENNNTTEKSNICSRLCVCFCCFSHLFHCKDNAHQNALVQSVTTQSNQSLVENNLTNALTTLKTTGVTYNRRDVSKPLWKTFSKRYFEHVLQVDCSNNNSNNNDIDNRQCTNIYDSDSVIAKNINEIVDIVKSNELVKDSQGKGNIYSIIMSNSINEDSMFLPDVRIVLWGATDQSNKPSTMVYHYINVNGVIILWDIVDNLEEKFSFYDKVMKDNTSASGNKTYVFIVIICFSISL
jgi:hypothetical protein